MIRQIVAVMVVLLAVPSVSHAVTLTYQWNDLFHIYGQQPAPQVNGFDYWFSPEQVDTSLAGANLRIDKIQLTTPSTNLGNIVNFDMQVMLAGKSITLPEGQFTATHVDPVAGYNFNTPVHYHATIGAEFTHNSYTFDLNRNFANGTTTAYPYYSAQTETRSNITAEDGLHAKLFIWTGDNRNCKLAFSGATLQVTATVLPNPPAGLIDYQDFSDTSALSVNGNTRIVDNKLRLAYRPASGGIWGTCFTKTKADARAFNTHFQFQIAGAGGLGDWDGKGTVGDHLSRAAGAQIGCTIGSR